MSDGDEYDPIHLHGTMTVCPCGAETGITCVAFGEDYEPPSACGICGKPREKWCDTRPWREVGEHELGCREHPETGRCDACGGVMTGTSVTSESGTFHFHCSPDLEPEESPATL